jgi:hypothetical protein
MSPITLSDLDPAGVLPEPYPKPQLLEHLEHDRQKARARIENLTHALGARVRSCLVSAVFVTVAQNSTQRRDRFVTQLVRKRTEYASCRQ